jgi:hypothetical protein
MGLRYVWDVFLKQNISITLKFLDASLKLQGQAAGFKLQERFRSQK